MSFSSNTVQRLSAAWHVATGLAWVLFAHPFFRATRPKDARQWVIGGHRGRLFADNSAAVFAEAQRRGIRIRWVANADSRDAIPIEDGFVLVRHSWAARKAISQAGVLIYSHGEDDLDLVMILLRGRTALRVYLDHGMCLLKGGGVTEPGYQSAPRLSRMVQRWLITRWDATLCASEEVIRNFEQAYPMNSGVQLDGGAHLDQWVHGLTLPTRREIYWFPTFRDDAAGKMRLTEMIAEVTSSAPLRQWLLENNYAFRIGSHINSGASRPPFEHPFLASDLSTLVADIRQSVLLISDYSSVMFDFLIFDRPQILFAFDLSEYLSTRHLFTDYPSLTFGWHPHTSDELVSLIVGGEWQANALAEEVRSWRRRCLPADVANSAARSVDAIVALVDRP